MTDIFNEELAKQVAAQTQPTVEKVAEPEPAPAPAPETPPAGEAPPKSPEVNLLDDLTALKNMSEEEYLSAKKQLAYSSNESIRELIARHLDDNLSAIDCARIVALSETIVNENISKNGGNMADFGTKVRETAEKYAVLKKMESVASKAKAEDHLMTLNQLAIDEFGRNHYLQRQRDAEHNYANHQGIPIEDVRNMSVEKYKRMLEAFNQRGPAPIEGKNEVKPPHGVSKELFELFNQRKFN